MSVAEHGLRTVVCQSYRTVNVPGWLQRCMQTVREWAALRGFEYRFVDDRFFDYVPQWYRDKVDGQILPMSDLARLELARELLASGFERTIWFDVDVAVFDPDRFPIDVAEEYAFCHEVWIEQEGPDTARYKVRVNNAVNVFVKNNSLLEFYIHAAKAMVRNNPKPINKMLVGTMFLTSLYIQLRYPLITNVGLFSPMVMRDIASGTEQFLRAFMGQFGHPVYAANLCSSFRNETHSGFVMNDALYESVLHRLLETKGTVLNQFVP